MLVFSAADFEDFRVAAPRHAAGDGGRARAGRAPAGREPLALPPARHLRRDDRARARRVREGRTATCRSTGCTGSSTTPRRSATATSTASRRSGGGIAMQHRMAFQGEYFVERYGAAAAERTPPIAPHARAGRAGRRGHRCHARRLLQPVGLAGLAGDRADGRRACASIRPANRLDRETALRLWTEGTPGSPPRRARRAASRPGQLADLAVLSDDYFAVPGGRDPRHHLGADAARRPGRPWRRRLRGARARRCRPPMPDWSPVRTFGGYQQRAEAGGARLARRARRAAAPRPAACTAMTMPRAWAARRPSRDARSFWGALGCACWAV